MREFVIYSELCGNPDKALAIDRKVIQPCHSRDCHFAPLKIDYASNMAMAKHQLGL